MLLLLAVFSVVFSSCGGREELHVTTYPPTANATAVDFNVNIYIENGGSMLGYVNGNTEFKDVISCFYENCKKKHSTKIATIHPETGAIKFQQNLDPRDLDSKVFEKDHTVNGRVKWPQHSDFEKVFNSVVNKTSESAVSVFMSDCVLDIIKGSGNIAHDKFMSIIAQKRKSLEDLSVCIYQFESSFKGNYYYPKGAKSIKTNYDGKRPYYVWVIGSKANVEDVIGGVGAAIKHSEYSLQNSIVFAPSDTIPNTLLSHTGANSDQAVIYVDGRSKKFVCKINADLKSTLLDDEYVCNVANYTLNNIKGTLESIEKIDNDNFSHQIVLELNGGVFTNSNITLNKPDVSQWVVDAAGNADADPKEGKTFAIDKLISGIADAFNDKQAGRIYLQGTKSAANQRNTKR